MKTRIISSAVAIMIAVILLFLHNTIVFNIAISLLTAAMLFEIFSAQKCLQYKATTSICFVFALVMPFFFFEKLINYRYLFLTICIISLFFTFIIQHKTLMFEKLCVMITSSILITLSMNSIIMIKLHNGKNGLFMVILSLCGAWLADSGAYFTGTFFGKHKLCPSISPKKTVEGLIGGTITNAFLFVIIGLAYKNIQSANDVIVNFNYIYLALLGMGCSLLGLLGDLSASLLKRQCQIKDYGNIMPGHGGVLDRFDSVIFVVPFMSLATSYLTIIK